MMASLLSAIVLSLTVQVHADIFEGRIHASLTRGGQAESWLFTSATNWLRVEITGSLRPNAVDILNRESGEMTLLFPHNRSFVRVKPAAENASAAWPRMPVMPSAPPAPANSGPTNLPGLLPSSAMPAMPVTGGAMMPPMPGEELELTATGDKTNLLGYTCEKLQIKQRGEVVEIWATDQLLPFQPHLQNQPPRFGPRMIEEQWGVLLKAKKLFPLLAVLTFENGAERLRFEVQSVKPEKIEDKHGKFFQPPADYHEIQPLPF